ncbi:MAG: hypothetical protein AAF226_17045, partial [Verrucomicrobiota bacterium]
SAYEAMGRSGFPLNRPFTSLEEVLWVRGMDQVAKVNPRWAEAFTLWSAGQIDLSEASPEVIAAAVGLTNTEAAERFVKKRLGPDERRGTRDDWLVSSVEEALSFLGAATETPSPLLTIEGTTRRIISTGYVGARTVRIAETRGDQGLVMRKVY